jgi:ribosomal protein S12 methylthiotransferase
MLASMRRGTTKASTSALVSEIRARVPGIALRTTLIAGYPGETKKDHQEMLDWVRETRFDRLGVFEYSHEENTHAFTLKDDVSAKEKKRRAQAVMEIQQDISAAVNAAKIGKTFKVLIDRKEGKHFIGRTEHDSPEVDNEVLVDGSKHYLRVGDFAQLRVVSSSEYDLVAEPA